MWIVELGRIGARLGEPATETLERMSAPSRELAERAAAAALSARGVPASTAVEMSRMAGYSWCDDFPSRLAVRIAVRESRNERGS